MLLEIEVVVLLLANHRMTHEGHVSIDLVDPVGVRCYQQQCEPRAPCQSHAAGQVATDPLSKSPPGL